MLKLSGVPSGAGIEFLEAEVFLQPELPFSIVYFALNRVRQTHGLRADLDKQIFLDHFDDAAQENAAQQALPSILDRIYELFSQPAVS